MIHYKPNKRWLVIAARGFGLIDDTDPAAWRPPPANSPSSSPAPPLTARWTLSSAPNFT